MNLRDFIKQKGITGSKFAKNVGVTGAHLSSVMNFNANPSDRLVRRIVLETDGQVGPDDLIQESRKAALIEMDSVGVCGVKECG